MKSINSISNPNLTYPTISVYEEGDILKMKYSNGFEMVDNGRYIEDFCPEVKSFSCNSILIGGLSLGIIPYYIQQNQLASHIDIIEINPDVISAVNELGHLNSNINIINGDVFNYSPSQSYDIIVMDLWWGKEENLLNVAQRVIPLYTPYLNPNGKLYIPILNYFE